MIYFILKNTNSEDSLSCQNTNFQKVIKAIIDLKTKEFNCFKTYSSQAKKAPLQKWLAWCSGSIEACGKPFLNQRKANAFRGPANLLSSQGKKRLAKRTDCMAIGKETLRTENAKRLQRALGPGSTPGAGPKPILKKKRLAKRTFCFAKQAWQNQARCS